MIIDKDPNGKRCMRIATLTFSREQLLREISNCSYYEGNVLDENDNKRHIVQEVLDDGMVCRVTKMLNLAYAEVVEMLYPYSNLQKAKGCNEDIHCDVDDEVDKYVIVLTLPEGFSATTVNLLQYLSNEYMICRVMSDLLGISHHNGEDNWLVKLDDVKDKINRCKNNRSKPLRRKMHPF